MPKGIRRIVTGHDNNGIAIIMRDDLCTGFETPTKDAIITNIWSTREFPTILDKEIDGRDQIEGLVNKNGSVLRILEMHPFSSSPFHRTISIDYGIIMAGEIILELDNNKKITLNAGDIIVQQGTIHAWHNLQSEKAIIAFVLIGAKSLNFNGEKYEETDLKTDFKSYKPD